MGGNFFAQGIEGVTGCSVLRGTMRFAEKIKPLGDWTLRLRVGGQVAAIRLRDHLYTGADEVLRVKEDVLFDLVELERALQPAPGGNGHA